MCIGIPMQVLSPGPGRALVQGRGRCLAVDTALVGQPTVGEWLLVSIDSARERISPARAAEVNTVLDLVEEALLGAGPCAEPGFALPSTTTAAQLAALCDATGDARTGEPRP